MIASASNVVAHLTTRPAYPSWILTALYASIPKRRSLRKITASGSSP
jgi:hypothetical protein